ncbi:MAG: STAS-like domain-containing protein [Cytophagales bacterium]|jgi:uncharacterized NAD-dependent epimerase/dehydratase family protein
MKTIKVVDFSEHPGLRHCKISDDSGEEFYHKILNRSFKESFEKNEKLLVDLDNTAGYAPSFIDEAFGNLVYDFGLDIVKKHLVLISEQEPDLIDKIQGETYELWSVRKNEDKAPEKTTKHKSWFFLDDGEIKEKK